MKFFEVKSLVSVIKWHVLGNAEYQYRSFSYIYGFIFLDTIQPSILDVLSKTSPKKPKATKKLTALKLSSTDSEDAAPAVVEKKPAKKRKTALSSDQSDSSDSDSGNLMARLKGKSTAGKVV